MFLIYMILILTDISMDRRNNGHLASFFPKVMPSYTLAQSVLSQQNFDAKNNLIFAQNSPITHNTLRDFSECWF